MSRAPRVTGPELISALAKAGFAVLRIKGSHYFLTPPRWAEHGRARALGRDYRSRFIA
jgi:predicted RNA binding protein YcfA (HicA-like mRNA interferase family)